MILIDQQPKIGVSNVNFLSKNQIQEFSLQILYKSDHGYTAIAASDNKLIVSRGDSKLKIYSFQSKQLKCIHTMLPHSYPVYTLHCYQENIFTTEHNQQPLIKIWNINNFNLVNTFKGHQGFVTHISCKSKKLFASSSLDKMVFIWQLDQLQDADIKPIMLKHSLPLLCVQFYQQSTLLTGGDDCMLHVWNWKQQTKLKTVLCHINSLNFIVLSFDNQLLLTGGGDGIVKFWSIDNLKKHKDITIVMVQKQLKISDYQLKFCCKINNCYYICDSQNQFYIIEQNYELQYQHMIKGITYLNNGLFAITESGSVVKWDIQTN